MMGDGTVSLELDEHGRARLVTAGGGPVADANRFLAAVATRGLSPATVRAYGFDLVVLYRWLRRRRQSLHALSAENLTGVGITPLRAFRFDHQTGI